MKFLRHLAWPLVLLPALAAFAWTSFAARLPESPAARSALGETTMAWQWADVTVFRSEPAHLLARVLHLGVLSAPGSSFWWAAVLNALLALLIVFAFAGVARRALGLGLGGQAAALGLGGLLVCSPAHGADWIHSERLGLFVVPLLLLWGTWLLLGARSFVGRALLVLLLAAAAPLFHTNGLLVFVALAAPLLAAARTARSRRRVAWIVALLLIGNVAAISILWFAGGLAVGGEGLLARAVAAPVATLRDLMATTGSAWLDPLPATDLDEVALGAFSWLLPLALWRIGDRSDVARWRAAPWWGCVWFGLLLAVLVAERHGPALAEPLRRELTFGAFLLPVGCAGVLAARFGAALVPAAAGALAVLALQDWHRGIEALRLARQAAEREEMAVTLPESFGGSAWPAEWQRVRDAGWVPAGADRFRQAAADLATAPIAARAGAIGAGDARQVQGIVRSSLTGDNVTCVVVATLAPGGDGPGLSLLAATVPDGTGHGRNVPWIVLLPAPLADGARVRVGGYRLRSGTFVRLGPDRIVRGGALVAADAE